MVLSPAKLGVEDQPQIAMRCGGMYGLNGGRGIGVWLGEGDREVGIRIFGVGPREIN